MKTTLKIDSYKDTSLSEVAYTLLFKKFEQDNPNMDEDELNDKFHEDVISKIFEYGEFVNMEIEIDENLNIVGGRIIPFKK